MRDGQRHPHPPPASTPTAIWVQLDAIRTVPTPHTRVRSTSNLCVGGESARLRVTGLWAERSREHGRNRLERIRTTLTRALLFPCSHLLPPLFAACISSRRGTA